MQDRGHLASITILRGIAAFGVVLFHVRIFLWVGWRELRNNPDDYSQSDHILSLFSIPTPFLGECVLLFFVISGFCIHYPQAKSGNKFILKQYIMRRLWRIYPPYFVAVLISFLIVVLAHPVCYEDEPLLPVLLLIQNYYPHVNSQLTSNTSLWSIATEIELYITYPLMLCFWRKFNMRLSLWLFGIVSLISIMFYYYGFKSMAFSSLTFFSIWWAGAGLAELYARGQLRPPRVKVWILGMGMLFVGVCMQINGVEGTMFKRFLFGGFFVVLVWWCLFVRIDLNGENLVVKMLVSLGEISYSLYLIHYPLFFAFGYLWLRLYGSKPSNFLVPLVCSVLVIPIAHLFYRFVERPSHLIAKNIMRDFK